MHSVAEQQSPPDASPGPPFPLRVHPTRPTRTRVPCWSDACGSPCTCVCPCCDYDCGCVSCPSSGTCRAISTAICPFWNICATYLCRDPGLCRWIWTVCGSVTGAIWSRFDDVWSVVPGAASCFARIYCSDDADPRSARRAIAAASLCSCGCCRVSYCNLCYT